MAINTYVVTGKGGVVVRTEASMTSAKVGELACGEKLMVAGGVVPNERRGPPLSRSYKALPRRASRHTLLGRRRLGPHGGGQA